MAGLLRRAGWSVVLLGVAAGVLATERSVIANAATSSLPKVQTQPPDGDVIDASNLPPLRSAKPAPPPNRPGAEMPAVTCSDFPTDVLDAAAAAAAATPTVPDPALEAVPERCLARQVDTAEVAVAEPPTPIDPDVERGFVEGESVEVVAERDAFTAVFENPDGSETVRLSDLPQHYEVRPGRWEPIDSSLVPVTGEADVFETKANEWTASFTADGMSLTLPEGDIGLSFVSETKVEPTVSEDRGTVSYRQVWPGVDVEYWPYASGVEEYLTIHERDVPLELPFTLSGAKVTEATETGGVRLDVGDVELSGLFTEGVDGYPVPLEGAPRLEARGEQLVVVIDAGWLAAVPDEAFPLRVDPSFWIGSDWRRCFARDNGAPTQQPCTSGARSGQRGGTGGLTWRSAMWFDYWAHMTPDSVVTSGPDPARVDRRDPGQRPGQLGPHPRRMGRLLGRRLLVVRADPVDVAAGRLTVVPTAVGAVRRHRTRRLLLPRPRHR